MDMCELRTGLNRSLRPIVNALRTPEHLSVQRLRLITLDFTVVPGFLQL